MWERQEMYTKFKSGNMMGRDHLGDLGIDRCDDVDWILRVGSCEYDNKTLGSSKGIKFLG
jgi:hypothetical protein